MNMSGYSLERLATSYLRERDIDAANLRRLALLRESPQRRREAGPFMRLLGWWVRLTALLLRYPLDPARAAVKLTAIGIPATLLAGRRSAGGGGNV